MWVRVVMIVLCLWVEDVSFTGFEFIRVKIWEKRSIAHRLPFVLWFIFSLSYCFIIFSFFSSLELSEENLSVFHLSKSDMFTITIWETSDFALFLVSVSIIDLSYPFAVFPLVFSLDTVGKEFFFEFVIIYNLVYALESACRTQGSKYIWEWKIARVGIIPLWVDEIDVVSVDFSYCPYLILGRCSPFIGRWCLEDGSNDESILWSF